MADIDRAEISRLRRSYGEAGLVESEIALNPIEQLSRWLAEAVQNPVIVEANAMVLSTTVADQPTSRTVLLKDLSKDGLTFFTNYNSRKSNSIAINPKVSLLFPWYAMERQVMVTGSAERIAPEESDAYFATRPWQSQIGAWASDQSQPLEDREFLQAKWAEFAAKFPEGSVVPRPPHWGGYLVRPDSIEFWQGRYSRLHDRIRFTRSNAGSETDWKIQRFFP